MPPSPLVSLILWTFILSVSADSGVLQTWSYSLCARQQSPLWQQRIDLSAAFACADGNMSQLCSVVSLLALKLLNMRALHSCAAPLRKSVSWRRAVFCPRRIPVLRTESQQLSPGQRQLPCSAPSQFQLFSSTAAHRMVQRPNEQVYLETCTSALRLNRAITCTSARYGLHHMLYTSSLPDLWRKSCSSTVRLTVTGFREAVASSFARLWLISTDT